jgi:hypothetical protein
MPRIVILHVLVELHVRLSKSEKRYWVEERGDVGERLGRKCDERRDRLRGLVRGSMLLR